MPSAAPTPLFSRELTAPTVVIVTKSDKIPLDLSGSRLTIVTMYVRQTTRRYKDKTYTNYLLVESIHTPKGPRQKVICSLGDLSPRPADMRKSFACKAVTACRHFWPRALVCACSCTRSCRRSGRSPLRFGSSEWEEMPAAASVRATGATGDLGSIDVIKTKFIGPGSDLVLRRYLPRTLLVARDWSEAPAGNPRFSGRFSAMSRPLVIVMRSQTVIWNVDLRAIPLH